MGTDIRPELSKKNKYWIEKHRYYELKHFCLQYPIWKKNLSTVDGFSKNSIAPVSLSKTNKISNPTAQCAETLLFYSEKMKMIEQAARETDKVLFAYVLKAITEGIAYEYLKIPCCKNTYYELYRKFFWLLNKARN